LGTEFGLTNNRCTHRTYPEFEDALSGEFKDPMSALRNLGRIGADEDIWLAVVTPVSDHWKHKSAEKVRAHWGHHVSGRGALLALVELR
jgi:hypothetical protein